MDSFIILYSILKPSERKKKKGKLSKWQSEEALQIPEERREMKSKRERERYIQLKAKF